MDKLLARVQCLCNTNGLGWKLKKNRLVASNGSRQQAVRLARKGNEYILTSVVLSSTRVTQSHKHRRKLARLAWQRNAGHDIVTFAFDHEDRLVGQVRHPVDHLDDEELEVYLTTLARDCDRLEYLLSGADTF